MAALAKRLLAWNANWSELQKAISRDCGVPESWSIRPWAFIPEKYSDALKSRILVLADEGRPDEAMPYPQITFLESVVPWNYVTWDRKVAALENEEQ